jgi:hypothetical protein
MGRPSDYSEKTAEAICVRLADGQSLRRICLDEGMPDRTTVLRWLASNKDFATRYAQAREDQAEFHHDEMEEIEDEVRRGVLDPKAANVILGNKRWRMEKLKPKAYGQKLEVEHSGRVELADTVRAARERAASREP